MGVFVIFWLSKSHTKRKYVAVQLCESWHLCYECSTVCMQTNRRLPPAEMSVVHKRLRQVLVFRWRLQLAVTFFKELWRVFFAIFRTSGRDSRNQRFNYLLRQARESIRKVIEKRHDAKHADSPLLHLPLDALSSSRPYRGVKQGVESCVVFHENERCWHL